MPTSPWYTLRAGRMHPLVNRLHLNVTRAFHGHPVPGPQQPLRSESTTPIKLEVEHKFLPTLHLESRLGAIQDQGQRVLPGQQENGGSVTFSTQPACLIRDTYFDLDDQLTKKGIWIRRRTTTRLPRDGLSTRAPDPVSDSWEAKIRLGGDYTASEFLEVEGRAQVQAMLSTRVPGLARTKLDDLRVTAELETHRRLWTARDEGFEAEFVADDTRWSQIAVVLDRVTNPDKSFRHEIGEVEMTVEVDGGGPDEDDTGGKKQEISDRMRRALRGFMVRHGKLFPTEPEPVGKLSAYFQWTKGLESRGTQGRAC